MPFRGFSALMVVLTCYSAYVQHNDPDPVRWMAMYLACALVALSAALGRLSAGASALVAAIATTWALFILPELFPGWRPGDLTATMIATRPEIEYGREFFGLLIVASYCVACFLIARRQAARPGRAS